MSLKAKIEAVIYAAEEPVTLLQLTGLLSGEAQAELNHQAAAQQILALEAAEEFDPADPEPSDPDALNEETLGSVPDQDPEPQFADLSTPDADFPTQPEETDPEPLHLEPVEPTRPEIVLPADASTIPPLAEEAVKESALPSVSDEKQLARETRAREARLRDYFRHLIDELVRDYATSDRGLEIREVAGGYRLATKPEYHDAVRGFVKSLKPPLKLSLQALETLAVVAYKQPVTAPEVSEIRGVDSGGVLGSLMTRKLVTTAGRKPVIGRPILYKTTKDFLLRFGLKDINELPSIEEFEKMAGELADQDPVQEEIPMPDAARDTADRRNPQPGEQGPESVTGANLEEERGATAPQADGDSSDLDDNSLADDVSVDGRLSGLPPDYDNQSDTNPDVDTPAKDAEMQSEQETDLSS